MNTQHRNGQRNADQKTNCGFGRYSPQWLQGLASKKIYVIVYGLLGMNQTAIGSYFIGTISTIEKRFKLPSSASGVIASSWDFGALCTVVSLALIGAKGHKTLWVSACSIIAAISCFLRYLPYSLYGPLESINSSSNSKLNLCYKNEHKDIENCSFNSEGLTTWLILIAAHIALGIGTSTYNTFGAAYLDDNTLKHKAPFLLSIVICLRHIGGMLGFALASLTLNQNETLDQKGSIDEKDHRWIGAWHLGWMPLGTIHLIFAVLMAAFPETLPREAMRRLNRSNSIKKESSNNGIITTFKRLMKNPILMCNLLSSTSHTFAIAGYWIFMPKYIETQFHQSASKASLITGTIGLMCTIVGTFLSGLFISKFKPPAHCLVAWSIFTKSVDLVVHVIFVFLSCSEVENSITSSLAVMSECTAECLCKTEYSPVCSVSEQITYFSPCQAGCATASFSNNGQMLFSNCTCLKSGNYVVGGPCVPEQCNGNAQFTTFIILLCFLKFLTYSSKSGNIIIQYRSVDAEDKSACIAVGEFFICGLAFIPAPIIYGLVLDWSCLVWDDVCNGGKTNCLLYNSQRLRYTINFMACGFYILAIILDYGVFKNVGKLSVYEEEEDVPQNISNDQAQIKMCCKPSHENNTEDSEMPLKFETL